MRNEVESVAIAVVEEALKVGRDEVETGRVRVRTEPQERTGTVTECLLKTDVLVERIAKDEEIEATPAVRHEGDTIVLPVVEERLVKKLFLVEEVRMSRRASTKDVNQQIQLRSQRVVVEREEGSGERSTEE